MNKMQDILESIMKSAIRIKKAIDVKDIGYSQEQNSSGGQNRLGTVHFH